MKDINEIKKIIEKHREELRRRFKVEKISIFGSYARKEQKEKSDIDILVEFNAPISLLHIVSLENYLSDILGIKADVVPKKNIRKELKDTILKEAISL
ncbi:MAG: nucleotidyltransferase family protein [Caldisericia bacterium]